MCVYIKVQSAYTFKKIYVCICNLLKARLESRVAVEMIMSHAPRVLEALVVARELAQQCPVLCAEVHICAFPNASKQTDIHQQRPAKRTNFLDVARELA